MRALRRSRGRARRRERRRVRALDADDRPPARAAERLHPPFALLSDAELQLTRALALPTFAAGGQLLLTRLTLVVRDGAIEHVFYPVFPPDRHAAEVLAWIAAHPLG